MHGAAEAVQEHVGNQLPDGKMSHHFSRVEVQKLKNRFFDDEGEEKIEEINRHIGDDEELHACWKPGESKGRTALVPSVVSHESQAGITCPELA